MNSEFKIWAEKHKIHIISWLLFITYEILAVGLAFNSWANPLTYILHYCITVSLFYLYANHLFPFAFQQKFKAIALVPATVVFQLLIFVVLHYLADRILISSEIIKTNKPYPLDKFFIIKNTYRGSLFVMFAAGYYFLLNYIKERKRVTDLEQGKLRAIIRQQSTEKDLFKAQNAFLKAQINPHFLFNTLNFIHNKVSASSPEGAEAVILLADMMRYALSSDEAGGFVRLEDEMEQVTNLISLFKLRKNQLPHIKIMLDKNAKHIPFIPLVLLTLTENMFKHGQLDDEDHPAKLSVFIEGDVLYFLTRNLSQPKESNREQTGLANIKARLVYAYGNNIQFNYENNVDGYFSLKLSVPLALLSATSP